MENSNAAIDALVLILENPLSKKGYTDLKKCYEKAKMHREAEAIDYLIEKRINNVVDDSHSDPK